MAGILYNSDGCDRESDQVRKTLMANKRQIRNTKKLKKDTHGVLKRKLAEMILLREILKLRRILR